MSKEAIRLNLIENDAIPKLDRAFALLKELRNGRYYASSNFRAYMTSCYKDFVAALDQEDYSRLKAFVIDIIPALIAEREERIVAYSLISDIVAYSCVNDTDVYNVYEQNILPLSKTDKKANFLHILTLAQTRGKVFGNIDPIEDFFISRYLNLSHMKTLNYKYLVDYSANVKLANKSKLIKHLLNSRPFYNDKYFIQKYIASDRDLAKYAILI